MSEGAGVEEQGDEGGQGQCWCGWSPSLGAWERGGEAGEEAVLDEVRAEVDQLWATGHIQPQPVFINEVSVECNHIHFRLWMLLCYTDRTLARPWATASSAMLRNLDFMLEAV